MSAATRNGFAFPHTAREAFVLYRERGLECLPVPDRDKDPRLKDWQNFRLTEENADEYFPEGVRKNIAVRNGAPSSNVLDADLDCAEARAAAHVLLPTTGWVFGRKGTRGAHRLYRADRSLDRAELTFEDPVRLRDPQRKDRPPHWTCILELRGTGGITIYPPSRHKETGEPIEWESFDEPGRVALDELVRAVRRTAAAALLGRYWPGSGSRQKAAMHLAGALSRAKMDADQIRDFIRAVAEAAGDDDVPRRLSAVGPSQRKVDEDRPVTGWPALAELLGPDGPVIVRQLREWLDLAPAQQVPVGTWPEPIPLDRPPRVPPFPTQLLPEPLADWSRCLAEATQTPVDLAGMLSLAIAGAGLAGKFRARVRDGWLEPLNLFVVVSLQVGERKSAVFRSCIAPVVDFEAAEKARLAPVIAAAASERRQLEARLKAVEGKAAKAPAGDDLDTLKEEAKSLAQALAAYRVMATPRLFCDDVTPEKLANILAEQGGKILQASPEGGPFEIVKGRYSEGGKANLDVYLKGHAGDPLRVARIGREDDLVDDPALSVALAVQPDVIAGLAEQATLRNRGFLARPLYGLPPSMVGSRKIAPRAVPQQVAAAYRSASWPCGACPARRPEAPTRSCSARRPTRSCSASRRGWSRSWARGRSCP